jgi:hypothetical protein
MQPDAAAYSPTLLSNGKSFNPSSFAFFIAAFIAAFV